MKKYIWGFLRRGLVACGFGPLIWAIVYFFLEKNGVVEVLSVRKAVMVMVFLVIAILLFFDAVGHIGGKRRQRRPTAKDLCVATV